MRNQLGAPMFSIRDWKCNKRGRAAEEGGGRCEKGNGNYGVVDSLLCAPRLTQNAQRFVNDGPACVSIASIELANLRVAILTLPHLQIPQELHSASNGEATKQSCWGRNDLAVTAAGSQRP